MYSIPYPYGLFIVQDWSKGSDLVAGAMHTNRLMQDYRLAKIDWYSLSRRPIDTGA